MATLNVCSDELVIDKLIFGSTEEFISDEGEYIGINDPEMKSSVIICAKDIDNLIKALQKAKELWHNKT